MAQSETRCANIRTSARSPAPIQESGLLGSCLSTQCWGGRDRRAHEAPWVLRSVKGYGKATIAKNRSDKSTSRKALASLGCTVRFCLNKIKQNKKREGEGERKGNYRSTDGLQQ